MPSALPILPVLIPLFALCLLLRWPRQASAIAAAGALCNLVLATFLFAQVRELGVLVHFLGDWPAPYGIALLADTVSAWMLLAAAWLLVGLVLFCPPQAGPGGAYFQAMLQLQWMGLNGAFLTTDVFNLFVCFEVLLIGSYGIALHRAAAGFERATLRYVVVNLAGSALFLIAAGLLYGVLGSLGFADLAQGLADLSEADRPLALAGVSLLAVVFLLKAAALPLSAWLPPTYAGALPLAAAAFTLLTKLGAYGLLRILSLWGPALGAWPLREAVALCGLATLLLAAIGAASAYALRRAAAWSVLASSGFLLLLFAQPDDAAVAAALFYVPASALSASALFLAAELHAAGRLDGPARLGLGCAVIGVAGLPPLAGFVAKLWGLHALLSAPGGIYCVVLVLLASLLSVIGLARATLRAMAGPAGPSSLAERGALLWLCGGALALSVCAAPLQRALLDGAAQALSANDYRQALQQVLPR